MKYNNSYIILNLQSPSRTPEELGPICEGGIRDEYAQIHLHFKNTGLKKQENDSIIHESYQLHSTRHCWIILHAALTDVVDLNPSTVQRRFPFFLISKYANLELNFAENTFPSLDGC